ncbi:trafficking protein particle complex subunit 13 homolog isoform X2 [Rosa chinensis]|uniref:trafficking protein particle complex subunit 13 homolog isoform X2 n=1 Tax=Rosa chinensis TaxID=74649 RepID=UPI000D0948D0|nr:trafficking protein particle complex subunit 13 homolog isoform X2 [Rosa chinensis]
MSSTGQGGPHSLAFRVMRLCKPSFQVDSIPLLLDPADLLVGEDIFDDPVAAAQVPRLLDSHVSSPDSSDPSYRTRLLLHHPSDSIGVSGLLVLPQAFGAIYLGETFCSYISINNSSNFEVRDIIIKAEMQTERQRLVLLETSKSPVESIRAGGRYDFIVEHDVKELGAHTLVCTALYNDGDGERKYLPQFFKFIVANPLSVRTKVRVVKETTFLEACIENHTKSNLFMDQVEFEPAGHWGAKLLKADEHHSEMKSQTREMFKPPVLIRSGGGVRNYLYQLISHGSAQTKVEGSNILGKLQITWRTNLGEPGRLQTQQIMGTPITRKDIELQVVEIPSGIKLERPFSVFPSVEAFGSKDFHLNLIATKLGVQKITGITVFNTMERKSYDPLPDVEIFVDLD